MAISHLRGEVCDLFRKVLTYLMLKSFPWKTHHGAVSSPVDELGRPTRELPRLILTPAPGSSFLGSAGDGSRHPRGIVFLPHPALQASGE